MPTTPTDIQVPGSVPVLPGAALTGRYLLTQVAPVNRGDTLEAFRLADGHVALMVADVVGHGFPASIAATQVRTVLRERLMGGSGLVGAVESLHRLATHTPGIAGATVAATLLDPTGTRLEYVAAGHPPPMLATGAGIVRTLHESRSGPLGSGPSVRVGQETLADDAVLLLHTDGLTAGRRLGGRDATALLGRALAACPGPSLDPGGGVTAADRGEAICDGLLGIPQPPSGYRDDVALLLLQRRRPPRVLALRLPALPSSVTAAREEVSGWLSEVGSGLVDQVALCHAVGELAANVIEHAYRPGAEDGLFITACLEDRGSAVVTVTDRGRWRDDGVDGLGLAMVSGLTDELRIRRTPHGTEIELHQELRRPIALLQESAPALSADPVVSDGDLEVDAAPGRLVVAGMIDEVNAEMFQAALREATRAGTEGAVLDLSRVSLLASPGLQAILETIGRVGRVGARLRIVAPAGSPADLILGLVDVPHLDR